MCGIKAELPAFQHNGQKIGLKAFTSLGQRLVVELLLLRLRRTDPQVITNIIKA